MLQRKKYTIVLILIVIGMIAASFLPIEINHKIKTRALIQPVRSWELGRLQDGSLSSLFRNQMTGAIESYGVTEFRRGDVVRFEIWPDLYQGLEVSKGDTIGILYSNDEHVQMAMLKSQLEVLKAERRVIITGEKPENVRSAERELDLAKRDLESSKQTMERTIRLLADSVISVQKYELDENDLQMKKLAVNLAEARLAVVSTGEKPERIALISAQIESMEEQIRQLEYRMEQLTLFSPMDGVIVMDRNYLEKDLLVKVVDISKFIGVAPVLLRDKAYIQKGNSVLMREHFLQTTAEGIVHDFNNVSEMMRGETVVFFTVYFENNAGNLMPGKMVDIDVAAMPLNPQQYIYKLFRSPM